MARRQTILSRRHVRRVLCILGFLVVTINLQYGTADLYDEYVQEVLNEYDNHYQSENVYDDSKNDNITEQEEKLRQQKQQQEQQYQDNEEKQRQAEHDRIEQETNDRIQHEREKAFEMELVKMAKDKQQAAKKQKKIDARIVQKVLRASNNKDHYGVLRLLNFELTTPEFKIRIPIIQKQITIPQYTFLHVPTTKIRKAYRDMAKLTHPDKNRDGRANEAFVAVENSASILMDANQRQIYDASITEYRYRIIQQIFRNTKRTIHGSIQTLLRSVITTKKILGPFAFPVFVIGALLI